MSLLPTTAIPELFHVGTMDPLDPTDKAMGGPSYEGEGLSVCRDPDAWVQVAQLDAMPWWRLSNPDGAFVDRHGLSDDDWESALSWACAQGWVLRERLWEVRFFDGTLDAEVAFTLVAVAEAREEARAHGGRLCPVPGCCATDALARRTGVKPGEPGVEDLALACWVADMSALDGIWWDDPLDPGRLSAPRGVVMPGALHRWNVEPIAPGGPLVSVSPARERLAPAHLLACYSTQPHCREKV